MYNQENKSSINSFEKINNIKQKTKEIFQSLEKEFSQKNVDQKTKAYLLFKYVVEHSKYDSSIMDEKANENGNMLQSEINDIHKCLCQGRSVCSSDASSLAYLFKCCGIDSTHLTIANADSIDDPEIKIHEVVKMSFEDGTYICDPTLIRSSLEDGIIPAISPKVFAFDQNCFFGALYKDWKIKFENQPIDLRLNNQDAHLSSSLLNEDAEMIVNRCENKTITKDDLTI